MANPYYIEPANPLAALMAGQQGYDTAHKQFKENQLETGRQKAMQSLQSGGDLKGTLAELIGIGDVQGAGAIANFANQSATQDYHNRSLTETSQHNRNLERLTAEGHNKPIVFGEQEPYSAEKRNYILRPNTGEVTPAVPRPTEASPAAPQPGSTAPIVPTPVPTQSVPAQQPTQPAAPRPRNDALFNSLPPDMQGKVREVEADPAKIHDYKGKDQQVIERIIRNVNPDWTRPPPAGVFTKADAGIMADQYLAGDKSVLQNFRGAEGPRNMAIVRGEITRKMTERGITGPDQAAALANFSAQVKAAGASAVREANVESSVNEAIKTFPLAIEASKNVPRAQFVPYNKLVQLVQTNMSNPAQAQLLTAIQGARTAYSQAMSRTGVNSVHAQQAADHLFSGVTSHETLVATLEQAAKEMQAAKEAPEETRKAILARISGRPVETHGTPVPTAAPATSATTPGQPPPQAIDFLKKNPRAAEAFDAKYGAGMAAKVLGVQ